MRGLRERHWRPLVAALALVPALMAFRTAAPFAWDRPLFDLLATRQARPADPRIVLVEVDDASLRSRQARWPLARRTWADLIRTLGDSGAAVIGLDAFFPEPAPRAAVELALETASTLRDASAPAPFPFPFPLPEPAVPSESSDTATPPPAEEPAAPACPPPPPDPALARIAEELETRAVRLDEDRALAEAIAGAGAVVLGVSEGEARTALEAVDDGRAWPPVPGAVPSERQRAVTAPQRSIESLASGASTEAMLTVPSDPDTVARHYPYLWNHHGSIVASLALAMAQVADPKGAASYAREAQASDGGAPLLRPLQTGTLRRVAMQDVLSSPIAEGARPFEGALVIVGVTAMGAADFRNSTMGMALPGAWLQATALSNLLRGDWVRSEGAPAWVGLAIALLSVLLLAWLCSRKVKGVVLTIGTLAWIAAIVVGASWAVSQGWWVPVTPMLAGLLLVGATETLTRGVEAERGRRRIRDAFQHYLSPTIVDQLARDPSQLRLGGHKRVITAFFSDIRGFSSFAERMEPEELIKLMNEALGEMTDILLAEGATIDKYIGDAIVAMFNAPLDQPDHAERTVRAAMRCVERLHSLRASWLERGYPEVYVRIGLNSGEAVVGNLGSDQRFDYTMIGDAVNLAARLEGASSVWGVQVLVGEETMRLCGGRLLFRELDSVRVKGRQEGVRVYEPMCLPGNETDRLRALKTAYELALTSFRERRFDEARRLFSRLAADGDAPSIRMLERIGEVTALPVPDDWDAVYEMKGK